MKCSVLNCRNQVKFTFPSNVRVKKMWLEAIRRPYFMPSLKHGLCVDHFYPSDILKESYKDGYKRDRIYLKRETVPKIFPWQKEINENIETHALNGSVEKLNTVTEAEQPQNCKIKEDANNCIDNSGIGSHLEICSDRVVSTVNILSDHDYFKIVPIEEVSVKKAKQTVSSQTISTARYNIDDFKNKPKSLLHFTGLENYEKFMKVLHSLGSAVYRLKYEKSSSVGDLNIPNQLFLVLWKLRLYPDDIELAEHFNVSIIAVGNIFKTWIKFMSKIWSLMDLWPSQELINFFTPETFKKNYPSTRVVDDTEIKTDASSNPLQKQSSFSSYNVKIATPRPLAYQNPKLLHLLQHKIVMKDRNLSRHRVHIERLIELLKTFTILSKKLDNSYLPLITDIIGVCIMLINFKENNEEYIIKR